MLQEEIGALIESGKDFLKQLLPELESTLQDGVSKIKEHLGKNGAQTMIQWIKGLISAKNVSAVIVERLSQNELFDIAKKNIATGADAFAVFRQQRNDGIYVFLANCKGYELLPQENNKYVIVKASSLSDDVHALFNESDLIILK